MRRPFFYLQLKFPFSKISISIIHLTLKFLSLTEDSYKFFCRTLKQEMHFLKLRNNFLFCVHYELENG